MADMSLVERLQEVAGDHLRSVVRYEGKDLGLDRKALYERDDVASTVADYDLPQIRRIHKLGEITSQNLRENIDATEHFSTIRVFDSLVIVYFPHGDDRRTVVTLDTDGLSRVSEVVAVATEELYPHAEPVANGDSDSSPA